MAQAHYALQHVQAELAARVGAIHARVGVVPTDALARELDEIRRIALAHGIFPAVTVARALDSALSRGEAGALIQGWLTILREAVSSVRHDRSACDTYAAACAIRYAG
jgi:hypothetical protein